MTLFYLLAGVLVVLGIVVLTAPLLNPGAVSDQRIRQRARAAHKQLRALKSQLEKGDIDKATFETQRHAIATELIEAMEPNDATVTDKGRHRMAALATALLIPALSIGLYAYLGQPQLIAASTNHQQAAATPSAGHGPNMPPVDEMIAGLEKKLEKDPNNAEGWFMLGRSYMLIKNYPKAVEALKRTYELASDNPDVITRYADALAMTNDGTVSGKPAELIQKALAINPKHPEALWLAGIASMEAGKPKEAIDYWQRAKQNMPPDAESQGMLDKAIAKARADAGIEAPAPAQASNPTANANVAQSNQTAAIQVTVSLDPSLAARAKPDDLVFIYAKAASGPPMPLAVQRKKVKDLPVTVTLDDSQAMMPALKLSGFDRVIVGARVSRSGNPIGAPGDLEGASQPLSPTAGQPVTIKINKVKS